MQLTLRVRQLRKAFNERLSEWQNATLLLAWGLVLALPGETLSTPAYSALRMMQSEEWWATAAIIGGGLRLALLAVNGAWRPAYYLRAWFAGTTMLIWITISLGFLWSGSNGTGLAIYPTLAVYEMFNVLRAARDAALAEIERRAATSPDQGRRGGQSPNPA